VTRIRNTLVFPDAPGPETRIELFSQVLKVESNKLKRELNYIRISETKEINVLVLIVHVHLRIDGVGI
jgi:hypothetical protein